MRSNVDVCAFDLHLIQVIAVIISVQSIRIRL